MTRTVCIVGAGIGGLSAIKSCLEEGLHPTCFESRSDLGGTWNYKTDEKTKSGRAYESLISNISKEASCFGDFPFPKEYPPYLSHEKVKEYLQSYANHFDLNKYICYNKKVVRVEPKNAVDQTKWVVSTQNQDSSQELEEVRIFDRLIVCVGLETEPKLPTIEGLADDFEGTTIHSCDYDSPELFRGKKVLVIGLGNSGADIIVDTSRQAKAAFLSTRSGAWIVPRTFEGGLPPDMTATTRIKSIFRAIIPVILGNWLVRKLLGARVNHEMLGVKSRYEPMNPRSTFLVNDELPSRIISGKVIVKPDVARFTQKEAIFVDGTREEIDCVICACGYETRFPFISNDILPDGRINLRLYEWMFPYEFHDPESIAVVGVLPDSGVAAMPVFECQTRYIAQVMCGSSKLPSFATMKKNCEMLWKELPLRGDSVRFRTQLGFAYQDRVAQLGGFYPSFWRLFFKSPALAFAVHAGPFLSYHYRLLGKNTWSGAPERIFNAIANTVYAIGSTPKLW